MSSVVDVVSSPAVVSPEPQAARNMAVAARTDSAGLVRFIPVPPELGSPQSDVPGQGTPLVRDEGTSYLSHTLEPMPVENHPAFEIVSRIVGLCRPKSVFRSRTGRLILVVEHLSDAERSRIEEVVGEGIEVRHRRPTPRPRA